MISIVPAKLLRERKGSTQSGVMQIIPYQAAYKLRKEKNQEGGEGRGTSALFAVCFAFLRGGWGRGGEG